MHTWENDATLSTQDGKYLHHNNNMKHPTRLVTIALLPILTLALGMHLGSRYEMQRLQSKIEELEFLFHGNTGDGQIMGDPAEEVDTSLLWAVWRLLLKHHIHPENLKPTEMLYGAVSGMVRAVGDPYSVFMTPAENKQFQQSLNGTLQGIGAELTLREGNIIVVAPLKGSPAAKAGLLPEDVILEVNGQSLEGKTLQDAVQQIRGPKGTQVKLTIRRKDDWNTHIITITRQQIDIPSVEYKYMQTGSGSYGYIAINQFADNTADEVRKALQELKKESLDGIILDTRYNGGGYLDRAVDLVSMFLMQGKVVSVARKDGEPEVHYVYGRPIDTTTPLAVLINEGSASASEILAGALQDHERAIIVGKKSFGKGTVQEIFEMPGGASVRITVAKWLTPNGRDLGQEGIDPDIEAERSIEDIENERDPQLDAAIEALMPQENTED